MQVQVQEEDEDEDEDGRGIELKIGRELGIWRGLL